MFSVIPAIATHVAVAWSVRPSVTLVHAAKATERNEMSFGRDSRVAQVTLC